MATYREKKLSKALRYMKGRACGLSGVEIKVYHATCNDPFGPSEAQMEAMARLSFKGSPCFFILTDALGKRISDKHNKWRRVIKALQLLDYLLHRGSELIITWATKNIYLFKQRYDIQRAYYDGEDFSEQGELLAQLRDLEQLQNQSILMIEQVRNAAKNILDLLVDNKRLRAERAELLKNKLDFK